jgi:hypothetical protein
MRNSSGVAETSKSQKIKKSKRRRNNAGKAETPKQEGARGSRKTERRQSKVEAGGDGAGASCDERQDGPAERRGSQAIAGEAARNM